MVVLSYGKATWLRVPLSVRLSVPSLDRCSSVRRVAAVGPAGMQAISIDSDGRPSATAPQQHGAQQEARAVTRCQLTCG